MASRSGRDRWVLEVVRGRDVGRLYVVGPGEISLGNSLAGAAGFDLADQEPSSPRRMAARQASLATSGDMLEIRDLESPGGTFVNNQRLLAGKARELQPGDMIQLGAVQLQVRREGDPQRRAAEPRPQPAAPGKAAVSPGLLPVPYTIAGGGTCRTWDDFLTLAAQRWHSLRDDLTSGRLAEHLMRVQRTDLIPKLDPVASADEQLDGWLARLPVTRSSAPELDVHPQTLIVRAPAGGGLVRQALRITNVGYRLLKSSVRIEPPGTSRVRLAPPYSGAPFLTIDQTELPLEIELPEGPSRSPAPALIGAVVIESNGGTRRVEIRLERPPRDELVPEATASTSPISMVAWGRPLGARVRAMPLARRMVLAAVSLMIFRLLVALAGLLPTPLGGEARFGELRLGSIGLLLAAAGLVAGVTWAARTGEAQEPSTGRDLAAAGFAGGMIGLFAAALCFAVIQSFESLLSSWSGSLPAAVVLWGVLGLGLALLSWIIDPPAGATSTPQTEPTS
jgi:hypothetical protein